MTKYWLTATEGTDELADKHHIIDALVTDDEPSEMTLCGVIREPNSFLCDIDKETWINLCSTCERIREHFDTVTKQGWSSVGEYAKQAELERKKYEHWLKHNSLAGFEA